MFSNSLVYLQQFSDHFSGKNEFSIRIQLQSATKMLWRLNYIVHGVFFYGCVISLTLYSQI